MVSVDIYKAGEEYHRLGRRSVNSAGAFTLCL